MEVFVVNGRESACELAFDRVFEEGKTYGVFSTFEKAYEVFKRKVIEAFNFIKEEFADVCGWEHLKEMSEEDIFQDFGQDILDEDGEYPECNLICWYTDDKKENILRWRMYCDNFTMDELIILPYFEIKKVIVDK